MSPTEGSSTAPRFPEAEDAPPKRKRSGCTCILFIVCSIVGLLLLLLVVLILPSLLMKVAPARAKAAVGVLEIREAVKEYAADHGGEYPESLEPLVEPGVDARWSLRVEALRDPWGREYLYEPPNEAHAEPRVYSLGRDGQPGGEGDDADIDSLKFRAEVRTP